MKSFFGFAFVCVFLCLGSSFAAKTPKGEAPRGKILAAKLARVSGDNVTKFTKSLNRADRKLLEEEIAIRMKRLLKARLSDKDKVLLKAYARAAKSIDPSPEVPVRDSLLKTLLYLEEAYIKTFPVELLERMGAHRSAKTFGKISSTIAKPQTVTLSSVSQKKGNELVSTGLYAIPGKLITVTTPTELTSAKLSVVIGHHRSVRPTDKTAYISMPDSRRTFAVSKAQTKAISPHGGLIMISVPKDKGLDKAKFTVTGAIVAPRFVLGTHNDQQWKTIRNAPAPWGELISDNLVMIIHSEALQQLDNPTDLMTWWNEAVGDHEGFYNYDRGYPFRMHMMNHARMGVSYWPLEWSKKSTENILCYRKLAAYNDGLFLHEHGHHADDGRMFFGNIGESTPNWAGYYMKGTNGDFVWKDTEETHLLSLLDPKNSQHQQMGEDQWWTTKYTHYWSYPVTSMMIGYAHTFGWDSFKKVVHRFTNPDDQINVSKAFNPEVLKIPWHKITPEQKKIKDQSVIDKWLVMLSIEAKRDIRPYMAHFQLKASPHAVAFIDSLKLQKWDKLYAPKRSVITSAGKSVKIPAPEKTVLTLAGDVQRVSLGKAKNGKLIASGDTMTYTPNVGFTGKDSISYSVKASNGARVQGRLDIFVVPENENPYLRVGDVKKVRVDSWKNIRFDHTYRNPVFFASVVVDKTIKRPRGTKVVVRVKDVTFTGCKLNLDQIAGNPDANPYDLTWFVIEAGTYDVDKHGIMGVAFDRTARPEVLNEKMVGEMTKSYDDDLAWLRAARFGQVATTNNDQWSHVYWQDAKDQCAVRFGCFTAAEKPATRKEKFGFAMLDTGLYQFGDVRVRVGRNNISTDEISVVSGADLKNAIRNRWTN